MSRRGGGASWDTKSAYASRAAKPASSPLLGCATQDVLGRAWFAEILGRAGQCYSRGTTLTTLREEAHCMHHVVEA